MQIQNCTQIIMKQLHAFSLSEHKNTNRTPSEHHQYLEAPRRPSGPPLPCCPAFHAQGFLLPVSQLYVSIVFLALASRLAVVMTMSSECTVTPVRCPRHDCGTVYLSILQLMSIYIVSSLEC